jgi:hypothetical protein
MKIDEIKNELNKMRIPKMNGSLSLDRMDTMEEFIQKIKQQDKDDEKYLLHNKLIPVLIGIFFITIVMLLNPIKSVILLSGCFLTFLGLFITMILLFWDYKNISKEYFNLNLLDYLKQKERRLQSWRFTPNKYKWTFMIFLTGLIMMIIGNTALIREFGLVQIIIYIVAYLGILITSWTIGEYFYRKRHREKHRPILTIISDLKSELDEK